MQQFSCAPQLIPSGHLRVLCPEVSTYGGMRVCVPRSLLALLSYTNANMRGARYLPSIHLISQPAAMPNEMPLQRCDDTCLPTTALNGFQVDPRSFPAKRWPKKHSAVFSLCYSPLFHPTWQYLTVLRARNKPTILRKRTSACTFQNNAFSKRTF